MEMSCTVDLSAHNSVQESVIVNLIGLVRRGTIMLHIDTYSVIFLVWTKWTLFAEPVSYICDRSIYENKNNSSKVVLSFLMQPHRVLIPTDEVIRQTVRQSIAFFVHPDNEVLVECIDGSNKYPAVTAREDTKRRLDKSYDPSVRTA